MGSAEMVFWVSIALQARYVLLLYIRQGYWSVAQSTHCTRQQYSEISNTSDPGSDQFVFSANTPSPPWEHYLIIILNSQILDRLRYQSRV